MTNPGNRKIGRYSDEFRNNVIEFDKCEYSSKILMFWQIFNGIKVGYSRVINTSLLIALTLSNPFSKIKFFSPLFHNPLLSTMFWSSKRVHAIQSNDVMIHDFYIKNVSNFSILFFLFSFVFVFFFHFNIDGAGKNRKLKCDP